MQAPESIQNVLVYRPVEYQMGPQAAMEVSESCINRYRMKVQALSFDEQRASFQLRAPGLGVVCSSNLFIESSWKIRFPARYNFASAMAPLVGRFDNKDVEVAPGANGLDAEVATLGYAPKICWHITN